MICLIYEVSPRRTCHPSRKLMRERRNETNKSVAVPKGMALIKLPKVLAALLSFELVSI